MVDVSDEQQDPDEKDIPSAWLMVLPILAMIVMMPIGLYITGDGVIIDGSGTVSVLWSVCFAIVVAWIMTLVQRLGNWSGHIRRVQHHVTRCWLC